MRKLFAIAVLIIAVLISGIIICNEWNIQEADIYFEKDDFGKADELYEKVFLKNLLSEKDILNIAITKINVGELNDALTILNKLEDKAYADENISLLNEGIKNIGRIYYENGNYQACLEKFKSLKNHSGDLFYVEEMFYLALKDYENNNFLKSLEAFKYIEENTKIAEDPVLHNALNTNLALNYYEIEEYKDCINYFEKREISNIMEYEKSIFIYYINALNNLNMYDEAIETISFYSQKFDDKQFRNIMDEERIFIYMYAGNYEEAQIISDKLIKDNPNNEEYYINQYVLYKNSHGFEYAQEYLKKLIGKFPKDSRIYKLIKE